MPTWVRAAATMSSPLARSGCEAKTNTAATSAEAVKRPIEPPPADVNAGATVYAKVAAVAAGETGVDSGDRLRHRLGIREAQTAGAARLPGRAWLRDARPRRLRRAHQARRSRNRPDERARPHGTDRRTRDPAGRAGPAAHEVARHLRARAAHGRSR